MWAAQSFPFRQTTFWIRESFVWMSAPPQEGPCGAKSTPAPLGSTSAQAGPAGKPRGVILGELTGPESLYSLSAPAPEFHRWTK